MNRRLMEFLRLLESAVPPSDGCHHAIILYKYGSGDKWEDQLSVCMRIGEVNKVLFLDDGDLDRPPADLVSDIVRLLEL